MITNKNNTAVGYIKLFGNVRVMTAAGLFIAMSIVLGKFLAINIGTSIRISFENLPVLMAGIFFGPFVGGAVGMGADIIGSILKGYDINPIITLGAASIGVFSGITSMFFSRTRAKTASLLVNVFVSVFSAHIIGSIIIKSIGMIVYYHTPTEVILLRIPLYIGIGLLEFFVIFLLLKNKAFVSYIERMNHR